MVRQLHAGLALHGILNLDEANSAYGPARARLPVRVLEPGLHDTAQATEHAAPGRRLLQSRGLKAADGSTVLLPSAAGVLIEQVGAVEGRPEARPTIIPAHLRLAAVAKLN